MMFHRSGLLMCLVLGALKLNLGMPHAQSIGKH